MPLRPLHSIVLAGLAGGVLTNVLVAQQAPTFRTGTDLLMLDVTAVDGDGRPVPGLAAADFEVVIDGRARPVRVVEFLAFGGTAPDPTTGEPTTGVAPTSTNQTAASLAGSRGGRVMVLLFDDLSLKSGEGKGLLVAAERMLATLGPDDLLGLTTTSGMGPVVAPTRDRGAVLAALKDKRLIGQGFSPTGEFFVTVKEALDAARREPGWEGFITRECQESDLACPDRATGVAIGYGHLIVHRTTMQADAYAGVMAALASAPQPRVLLVLSGGMAWSAALDPKSMFDRLARASADAGVQFYLLNEEPDAVGVSMTRALPAKLSTEFTPRGAVQREGAYLFDGAKSVASAVGGAAFRVVGQSDRFFNRVLHETSGVYRLGIDMDPWPTGDRPFRVRVTTPQRGVTLRTVAHVARPTGPPPEVPARQALEQRLAQGGLSFGVPMALNVAMRRDATGGPGRQLVIEVQTPADVPSPILAGFALIDEAGTVAQSGLQHVRLADGSADHRLVFPLPLGAGAHRLRFAMVDGNGSVGSVDRVIPAELPTVDRVASSDLLLSWSRGDAPARPMVVDQLPDGADTIYAMVELYPDRLDRVVTVRFELSRIDSAEAPIQQIIEATVRGDRLAADLAVKTGALPPGVYALTAKLEGSRDDAPHPQAVFRIREHRSTRAPEHQSTTLLTLPS